MHTAALLLLLLLLLRGSHRGALCRPTLSRVPPPPTPVRSDDFGYECEQIEVVIKAGEALPEGSVDLNAADVFAFYNAHDSGGLSLSMNCAAAPFTLEGVAYACLDEVWRAKETESLERCAPAAA